MKLANAQFCHNLESIQQKTESHQLDSIPKKERQVKQKKYSRKHPFFEKFKFWTKIDKELKVEVNLMTIIRNFAL